jgi:hypothetical protein
MIFSGNRSALIQIMLLGSARARRAWRAQNSKNNPMQRGDDGRDDNLRILRNRLTRRANQRQDGTIVQAAMALISRRCL